ncbi:hypothetical protein HZA40_01435 [Candidatus Peregrinibacteria bacterium]|nr:hypothetical protein [Candidatus Peregrinibacteria bacterium]
MTKADLQQAILKFLPTSTITPHQKSMIEILLPGMTEAELGDVYKTLSTEHEKMTKLNEKRKRIELKYKVMVEGLTNLKKNP